MPTGQSTPKRRQSKRWGSSLLCHLCSSKYSLSIMLTILKDDLAGWCLVICVIILLCFRSLPLQVIVYDESGR